MARNQRKQDSPKMLLHSDCPKDNFEFRSARYDKSKNESTINAKQRRQMARSHVTKDNDLHDAREHSDSEIDEHNLECDEIQDFECLKECEKREIDQPDLRERAKRKLFVEDDSSEGAKYTRSNNNERLHTQPSDKGLEFTEEEHISTDGSTIQNLRNLHVESNNESDDERRGGGGNQSSDPGTSDTRYQPGRDDRRRVRRSASADKEKKNMDNEQTKKLGNDSKHQQEEKGQNYYTSIVHSKDIQYPQRKGTACIIANHGDHIHILWRSTTGNSNRTRKQIHANFGFNNAEIAESVTTTQKVRDIRHFVRYLMRYGIQSITYINGGIKAVNEIIESTIPDENINCLEMWSKREIRREESEKHKANFIKHKKDAYDFIKDLVLKYGCTSQAQFNRRISPTEFEIIMTAYGPSTYTSHVRAIIKYNNALKLKEQDRKPFMFHIDINNASSKVQEDYLMYLFEENGIDFTYFMAWCIIIIDMHINKVNTLILNGPPNTGKSMLLQLITKGLVKAFITRTGDATQFHLQNCLDKRILLFEEPRITPATVDDMKLLLGGEEFDIQIKHSDPEGLKRTPVLISTNKPIGFHLSPIDNEALEVRSRLFNFTKIIGTHLEVCEENITPRAIINLMFKHHNGILDNFMCILMRRRRITGKEAHDIWDEYVRPFYFECQHLGK
jgi:hypothetical protein